MKVLQKELEERYKDDTTEPEIRVRAPKRLSAKETRLIKASQYLMQGALSDGMIAKFTDLKRSDVSNLRTRMMTPGSQVLPKKRGAKKRLQLEHINFLRTLIKGDDRAFLTLKSLKEHLIERFR